MLTRFRVRHPWIRRGVMALAASALITVAAVGIGQAQTIYFVTPSMDTSNACTTTTYIDDFGNSTTYVTCTPSTIYYTPGYEYYFVNP